MDFNTIFINKTDNNINEKKGFKSMTVDVMLIGLGELGTHILNFLVRTSRIQKITTADINGTRGICLTNQALYGAFQEGYFPDIRFKKVDLMDVEGTADFLREIRPKIICSTATLRGAYRPSFSKRLLKQLDVNGLGGHASLLSLTLILPYKLMQAVKKSGIDTHVVITNFPDLTCPVLGKVGLTPTVGGGNLDLRTPWFKKVVSEDLKTHVRNISVFLVAHHALLYHFGECPYWVKILVGGDDVTSQFPTEKVLPKFIDLHRRTHIHIGGPLGQWGRFYQQVSASSFLKNILAIYFDTNEIVNAPGPNGLPGGYPVRLSSQGAEVVLPEEISLKEAIKINEEGGRYDGIKEIKDDGTLVCTDGTHIKIEEIEDKAKGIMKLIKKHS